MYHQAPQPRRPSARDKRALGARLLAASALALAAVAVVYFLAVRTEPGQRFEQAALAGAAQHQGGSWYDDADRWLNRITAGSFAVSLAVIVAVGLVRRRWLLALCGVATAGGALLFARLLKNNLPTRPDLARAYEFHNTLPSGHATAAMGLFFAMLIVVSRRWYPVVTLLAGPGAVGAGVATIAANWHRLSDTVAADAVALAAGTFGLALMAYAGLVRPSPVRRKREAWPVLVPVTALALAALAIGAVYFAAYHAEISYGRAARDAYWAAQALSFGAGTVALAVMLAVVYRIGYRISAVSPVRA